jgi:hypothetical protein
MAQTLWNVPGAIVDRRGRKGRQFPLQAILAIAIAAMLAGANDLRAICRWGRRLPDASAHRPSDEGQPFRFQDQKQADHKQYHTADEMRGA